MSEMELHGVRLTNPDKVLFPEQGITKRDLAEYYLAVADHILPHIADRPITLVRCPSGQEKKCFFQRHAGAGLVAQVHGVQIPGFDDPYVYVRDIEGVIGLVQMGVLELHPWAVTTVDPVHGDRLIFDLDPDEALDFAAVIRAAIEVRDRLGRLGLESFVKTTGGKGLHVVAPIAPTHDLVSLKRWARTFSEAMAADAPDRYLTRMAKAERTGRIFIDYLRNDVTATAVGPYSTRSRPSAPVATPLDWSELEGALNPQAFTIATVPERLRVGRTDPWAAMLGLAQPLPDAP